MSVVAASKPAPARQVNGILLLDKPDGISSNHALQVVRRAFNAAKAGHTGNLDVAASGLLPICLGEATKVCGFLLESNKRYHAEIQLGKTSTTGDREGEIRDTGSAVPTSELQLEGALAGLRGSISQVPPMYSALKRNGQPLYKLARKGLEVERQPRQVHIHQLDLVQQSGSCLGLDIVCSKGTYIRSLAVTLGERLGCGGYLSALRRIAAGPFDITQAHPLDLFATRRYSAEDYDDLLLPMDTALGAIPRLTLNDNEAMHLKLGQPIQLADGPSVGAVRLYGRDQEFIGMGTVDSCGRLKPTRLLATNDRSHAGKR